MLSPSPWIQFSTEAEKQVQFAREALEATQLTILETKSQAVAIQQAARKQCRKMLVELGIARQEAVTARAFLLWHSASQMSAGERRWESHQKTRADASDGLTNEEELQNLHSKVQDMKKGCLNAVYEARLDGNATFFDTLDLMTRSETESASARIERPQTKEWVVDQLHKLLAGLDPRYLGRSSQAQFQLGTPVSTDARSSASSPRECPEKLGGPPDLSHETTSASTLSPNTTPIPMPSYVRAPYSARSASPNRINVPTAPHTARGISARDDFRYINQPDVPLLQRRTMAMRSNPILVRHDPAPSVMCDALPQQLNISPCRRPLGWETPVLGWPLQHQQQGVALPTTGLVTPTAPMTNVEPTHAKSTYAKAQTNVEHTSSAASITSFATVMIEPGPVKDTRALKSRWSDALRDPTPLDRKYLKPPSMQIPPMWFLSPRG